MDRRELLTDLTLESLWAAHVDEVSDLMRTSAASLELSMQGCSRWSLWCGLIHRMDAGQIDAVSAVLGAIAASAGAGAGDAVKDMTKASILGTRDRLIALVRGRLSKDPVGDAKLTVYAAEPTPANGQALQGHLVDAELGQDERILSLARQLLAGAGPAALAPGSVAATIITQTNTHGGTGYVGGQHVHHHGTPAVAQVTWELSRLAGNGYELRNTGTAAATDVTIDSNVELGWPTAAERDIPPGSSVMFICSPSLADPSPVVTVTYSASGTRDRSRWQRPLPL